MSLHLCTVRIFFLALLRPAAVCAIYNCGNFVLPRGQLSMYREKTRKSSISVEAAVII